MDELKEPYVSKELIEYLEDTFKIDTLLLYKAKNNDELVGFISGVREVIGRLKVMNQDMEV